MDNAQVNHVIKDNGKPVKGITMSTYNNMLYVVTDKQPHVDVYKLSDFTKSHQIKVDGINWPDSLVSCQYYKCLYISDDSYHNKCIHRIQLNDNNSCTKWNVKVGGFVYQSI